MKGYRHAQNDDMSLARGKMFKKMKELVKLDRLNHDDQAEIERLGSEEESAVTASNYQALAAASGAISDTDDEDEDADADEDACIADGSRTLLK
jgi:hypothetical protein